MSRSRLRVLAVLVVASMLSVGSSLLPGGSDGDSVVPVVESVLALQVELVGDQSGDLVANADGLAHVTDSFRVTLLACSPTYASTRLGIEAPRRCTPDPSGLSSNPDGLTATGTLTVRAERWVETADNVGAPTTLELLGTVPIGPLRFGDETEVGPFSYAFPAEAERDSSISGDFRYGITARLTDCRLSNGSICGLGADIDVINVFAPEGTTDAVSSLAFWQREGELPIEFREPNRVSLTIPSADAGRGAAITGSFELAWVFPSSDDTVFTTTGTIQGSRSDDHLYGQFLLDEPEASYLASALGASGEFSATISDERGRCLHGNDLCGELTGASVTLKFEGHYEQ